MTEDQLKERLLTLYSRKLDADGAHAVAFLGGYQDVAVEFGWKDVLGRMQQLAREKLPR